MKILLSTGCLYENPLYDVFEIARISGFDGIEFLIDKNKYNIPANELKDLCRKYDVPILSIHSPFVECDGWGGFWESIDRSIELAKELSVNLVNFHPQRGVILYHNLGSKLLDYIGRCRQTVKNSKIILTIENLPNPKHIDKIPLLRRMLPSFADNTCQIAEFARDNDIHVTFDTTHIGTTGRDILNIYNIFKGTIANIHLSDYDGTTQHLLPGRGNLPLKEFLGMIKDDKYDGLITLETQPSAIGAKDMQKAISNAKYCISYIRDKCF